MVGKVRRSPYAVPRQVLLAGRAAPETDGAEGEWRVFLTMMVVGLVGLVMMAVPAFGRHHHLPPVQGPQHAGSGPGGSHVPAAGAGVAPGHPSATPALRSSQIGLATAPRGTRRFIPSPRAVFSVLALYGAFGNAIVHAAHLTAGSAALIAIGPALCAEWSLIRPVWNLMFRFKADASSPLEELILAEAQAVVPFRNGRGLITTVRDGRRVQLNARLCDRHAALPVAFGQRLRIEDVDARRERVTVSLLSVE
jgi:hypothetical protein